MNFENLTSDYWNKNIASYIWLLFLIMRHETHNPDLYDYESLYFSEYKMTKSN